MRNVSVLEDKDEWHLSWRSNNSRACSQCLVFKENPSHQSIHVCNEIMTVSWSWAKFSRTKVYTVFLHLRIIAEEWIVRCLIAYMYSFNLICITEEVIWRHDAIVWVWKSMSENVQDQWCDILDDPKSVCVGMESHLCEDKFEKFLNDARLSLIEMLCLFRKVFPWCVETCFQERILQLFEGILMHENLNERIPRSIWVWKAMMCLISEWSYFSFFVNFLSLNVSSSMNSWDHEVCLQLTEFVALTY